MNNLKNGDYTLVDGRAWFTLKGFSIRLAATDEGILVDVYGLGCEDENPIASTWALDSDITEEEDLS